MARYCGSFCQHKDWEQHHQACGTNSARSISTEVQSKIVTAQTTRSTIPPTSSSSSSSRSSPTNQQQTLTVSSNGVVAPAK